MAALIATLAPAHPEKMTAFTLYKKKNGNPRCKVVAKFGGDEDHASSKDAKVFDC